MKAADITPDQLPALRRAERLRGLSDMDVVKLWYVAPDAYRTMQAQNVGSFDFDPFQIITRPSPPANVFMVTVLGNVRNEVLPILTDFQR